MAVPISSTNYSFVDLPSSTTASPMTVTLPANLTTNAGYRVSAVISVPSSYTTYSALSQPFTVNATPAVPAVVNVSYCQNAAATRLSATGASGATLHWYTMASGGSPLPEAPIPSTSTPEVRTYYVSQSISDCGESQRAAITVTINEIPQPPTIVTQAGHSYPGGVNDVTVPNYSEPVVLVVSGCEGGAISWSGGSSTTLAFGTNYSGTVTATYFAYCARNGCQSQAASTTIRVVPTPTQFAVTGGGSYCAGTTGPVVGLAGSRTDFSYQLLLDNNPVGNRVAGTGSALSFGSQSEAGTYTVRAASVYSSYQQTMSGSAMVIVNPLPIPSLLSSGPLSCAVTSVSLTAGGGTTYAFSGPGVVSQSSNSPTALVNAPGLYSVTVTSAGGCSATATTSVEQDNTLAAPSLTASAPTTPGQPISVTASGCTGGRINWSAQGVSGSANGSLYTFTQPGNYTLSASCTVGTCTSAQSAPLSLQILPAGFAITSVNMVNCQLTNAASGEYQVSFLPQYSGQNNNPISFSIVNEKASTTDPGPYSLRLYADNPAITLVANQASNAEARYRFNWLASCQVGTSPNQPPTTQGIPRQTILQGQAYQLQLTDYFSDPDGQTLTFQALGLPDGLTLGVSLISGVPSVTGLSTVSITALDPGGLSVSYSFQLWIDARPTTPAAFTITGVSQVSCEVVSAGERRLTFTPQYAGVDDSPISFSVVNERSPTTAAGPYSLNLYTDNPVITLNAQQGSGLGIYRYNWLAGCLSRNRQGVSQAETTLRVRVLGNPVSGRIAEVEISGAGGQTVRLTLVNLQGILVHEQRIEQATSLEQVHVPLGSNSGVLILQVSTSTQRQQVKLLKQ